MGLMKLIKVFQGDVRSLPSTYEFKLKVNINIKWLHLLKLGYVIVMAIILIFVYLTGGWNYKETGVSSVVIKVAGADVYLKEIWDATDYVYPPQEVRAFFITTRALITNQNQSTCVDNNMRSVCENNTGCKKGRRTENGVQNGTCDIDNGMCFIQAWCPVESLDSQYTRKIRIRGASNFTVYVRDHEEFIKFNISRSNDPMSSKSSTNCLFDPIKNPTCPIFKIGDILRESRVKFNDVKDEGGIFQFYIKWHCYFNWNSAPCVPRYFFKRIAKDNTGNFSGYSMRYAIYQDYNSTRHRQLITVHGLRFLIMIKSIGEKFKFIEFVSSVGSYLSYFGIWTFITGVMCAVFLVDKRDLMTLEESTLRKLVRGRNDGDGIKVVEGTEMKTLLKDNDNDGDQKVALV